MFGTTFCLVTLVILCQTVSFTASDAVRTRDGESQKCGPGFVLDLNDKCVKKFVVPKRIPCPSPEVPFGGFDLQLKGRMVEFWCESGWKLHPPSTSYAMCKVGQWDKAVPSCVRPGCQEFRPDTEMEVDYVMNGGVANFRCKEAAMELVGEGTLTCDGQFWNGTMPGCRIRPATDGSRSRPSSTAATISTMDKRLSFATITTSLLLLLSSIIL